MNLARHVAHHELREMIVTFPIVAREFHSRDADVQRLAIVPVERHPTFRLHPRREQITRIQRAHSSTGAMTIKRIQHGDGLRSVGGSEQAAQADAEPLEFTKGSAPNDCVAARAGWGFFCDYFVKWWQSRSDTQDLRRGGYKIVTTLCPGGKERMRRLMSMVQTKRFDPTPLLTHSFSLDQIVEAYDLFGSRRDGVLKVAIRP